MNFDPAKYAAVYASMMSTHDVADHVIQTDHQATHKASDWGAMAGHVGGYIASQALSVGALRLAGVCISPSRAVLGLALSAATHAFLDRRWPVVKILEMTGSENFSKGKLPALPVWFLPDTYLVPHKDVAQTRELPLPLHGPYLADQALHHLCVALASAIIASK